MQVRFLLGSPMFISIYVSSKTIRIASFVTPHNPTIIDYIEFNCTDDYAHDMAAIQHNIASISNKNIRAIGISVPGILDSGCTSIIKTVHLRTWENRPLKAELEKRFKCDVVLENSTTAAAMSEAMYGYGKDENFLFIIWGNGIGGTAVNYLHRKLSYVSFEPGHMIFSPDGRLCPCGQRGCLEMYIAGFGIKSNYHKPPLQLSKSEWEHILGDFATGLSSIIAIRPTPLIIFSGGISDEARIKRLHTLVKSRMTVIPTPMFRLATFQKKAALIGSLALIKHLGRY